MERIGERLRKRREELGFTIDDIARATKFRPETVSAVEEGRVSVFPAEAYLKAFLRAYAGKLGLDAGEIVREQKSEEERVRDAIEGIKLRPRRRLNLRRTVMWLAVVVAAAVAVLVVFDRVMRDRHPQGPRMYTFEESAGALPDWLEEQRVLETVPKGGATSSEESTQPEEPPQSQGPIQRQDTGPREEGIPETHLRSSLEVAVSGWPIRARLRSGDSVLVEGWLNPGYTDTFYCSGPFVIDYLTDTDALSVVLDGEPVSLPSSSDKQISGFRIDSGQ